MSDVMAANGEWPGRSALQQPREEGLALILAVMGMTLMLALGSALVLLSSSETVVAANFRAIHEATYAADAVLERALSDLRAVDNWTAVISGGERSSFTDGAPSGIRMLSDGSRLDLDQITNFANCQKVTVCSDADMAVTTDDRPWGANNPRWTAYAYGPLAATLGATPIRSGFYVIAYVADDPSENDDDPSRDGAGAGVNPGSAIIALRAESFGPRNAHRVVEAIVKRITLPPAEPGGAMSTALRVLSWRDMR